MLQGFDLEMGLEPREEKLRQVHSLVKGKQLNLLPFI